MNNLRFIKKFNERLLMHVLLAFIIFSIAMFVLL